MTIDRIASARRSSLLALFAGVALAVGIQTGCNQSSSSGSSTPIVNASPSISIVSGGNQSGIVNTLLPAPLQVLVKDAGGKPLANQSVTFAVATGGGRLSAGSATTGAVGTAVVTYTLGPTAGANTVTATLTGATGSPLTFTETGVFGGATKIVAAVNNVGCSINNNATLTALVTDAGGNPVANVLVTFTPPSSGGTLSATTATTDAQGHATVTFTGTSLGSFTVTASANGVAGSTSFTVVVSPPANAPIVSNISVVANSSATALPPIVFGVTAIQYTILALGGTPAVLTVMIDAGDGLGLRHATEAAWAAGTPFPGPGGTSFAVDGTSGVPTSAAGLTHVFLWDSGTDAPTAKTAGGQIQISAFIPGAQGGATTIGNVSIQNGSGASFGAVTNTNLSGGTKVAAGAAVAVLADIDLDGKLDLVTIDASAGGNTVQVYKGNGLGGFASPTTHAVGTNPGAVAVADLDQNGLPDIVVFNAVSNNVTILLQGPVGTFTPTTMASGLTTPPAAGATLSLALADIENTGNLDIVFASSSGPEYNVIKQWSPGNFIAATAPYPVQLPATTQPSGIAIADVTSDGKVDVVLSTNNGVAVVVSAASPVIQTYACGTNPSAVAIGDVNGDGQLDIVVANKGSNNVSVLLWNGAPAATPFAPAVNLPAGTAPVSVTLSDIDGNGTLDIVVADSSGAPNVTVLSNQTGRGKSALKFTAGATVPVTGAGPAAVLVGDLDRNGSLDLVTVNSTGANITFVPNGSTPHVPKFAAPVGGGLQLIGTPSSAVFNKVFVVDLNADGKPDVVAVDDRQGGTSAVNVFLGSGAATFGKPISLTLGGGSLRGFVIADFDGDGKLDFGCGDSLGNKFDVYLGNGDGTFVATAQFFTAANFDPQQAVVADINGDGKPDVIVLDLPAGSQAARVLVNQSTKGTISFVLSAQIAIGNGPVALVAGDVNGDGSPDFAVVNQTDQTVSVLINGTAKNSTTPVFTKTDYAVGTMPTAIAILDVNGDGHPDLVVASSTNNDLAALYGNGTGGFATAVNFGCGQGPVSIATGDLNNDGSLDLIVSNGGTGFDSVLLGGNPGGLVSKPDLVVDPSAFSTPVCAGIGDVTGDGKNDVLVVANGFGALSGNMISIFPGDNTADFTPKAGSGSSTASVFPIGSTGPADQVLADLNGDGILDVVVANFGAGNVSILIASPAGGFNPAVVLPLPSGSNEGPTDIFVADVNRDGKPDIVLLSRNFGSAPDKVVVLIQGAGNGTVFTEADYPTGSSNGTRSKSMTFADVNGDGSPDAIVVNGLDNTATIFLGSATGTYTMLTGAPIPLSKSAVGVAVGDLNNDGKPDLVFANSDGTISVYLGPTFALDLVAAAPPTTTGNSTSRVAVGLADLNRDGKLDLVVGYTSGTRLFVFPGVGDGTFLNPATPVLINDPAITSSGRFTIADVDRDGFLDVVVSNQFGGNAVLLLQSRTTPLSFSAGGTVTASNTGTVAGVAVVDFNHDGLPDIVITDSNNQTVQFFKQN